MTEINNGGGERETDCGSYCFKNSVFSHCELEGFQAFRYVVSVIYKLVQWLYYSHMSDSHTQVACTETVSTNSFNAALELLTLKL